jgi:thiamine-phosphate pyrophosphorylase
MDKNNIYKPKIKKIDYSLYLVADSSYINLKTSRKIITEAIQGGVSIVQLRAKDIPAEEFYNMALELKKITGENNIPFIINDRADIAMAVDADGIHVGQEDIPAKAVRELIGNDKILGVSVANLEEAEKAAADGADYLGAGAMFVTETKPDAKQVSIAELEKIKKHIKIPVVAIGGINAGNAEQVLRVKIDGICVISAILAAKDIKKAALELKKTAGEIKGSI